MKKLAIAGASVALAAMPVVSTFAVTNGQTITDTLDLTIENTCAMTVANGGRTAAASVIANGAWGDADATGNATFTGTVVNNHLYTEFASTAFTLFCNDKDGYQVTVSASDFEKEGITSTADYKWPYTKGSTGTAATLSSSASQWTLSSDGEGADLANDVIAKRTTSLPVGGTIATVKYSAFVDSGQPAETYEAKAVYTFAQL